MSKSVSRLLDAITAFSVVVVVGKWLLLPGALLGMLLARLDLRLFGAWPGEPYMLGCVAVAVASLPWLVRLYRRALRVEAELRAAAPPAA